MGRQETPVLSMPTWLTFSALGQSRIASRSRVVVDHVRTSWRSGLPGSPTSKQATTVSWWTSNPQQRLTRARMITSTLLGGERGAAGTVKTLPYVLPVSGRDKGWYLYAARAGLLIGVANHRRFGQP